MEVVSLFSFFFNGVDKGKYQIVNRWAAPQTGLQGASRGLVVDLAVSS